LKVQFGFFHAPSGTWSRTKTDYDLFETNLQRDVSSEILDDLSAAEEVIFESGPTDIIL
jgi:hypothetical protein